MPGSVCRVAAALVAVIALTLLPRSSVLAADASPPPEAKSIAESGSGFDPERFFQAIVKVQTRARCPTPGAARRSALEREGTGVVIGDDGLVLTIGYLIIEADEVSLVDQRGRTLPARVVGYDHVDRIGARPRGRAAERHAAALGRILEPRRARPGDDRQSRGRLAT